MIKPFMLKDSNFNATIFLSTNENPDQLNRISKYLLHTSISKNKHYLTKNVDDVFLKEIHEKYPNDILKYYIYHTFSTDDVEKDFELIFNNVDVATKYSKNKKIYCASTIAKNVLEGKFNYD